MKNMMLKTVVAVAALCVATASSPSFAADRTISADYTLTADETVDGVLTVDAGELRDVVACLPEPVDVTDHPVLEEYPCTGQDEVDYSLDDHDGHLETGG